MRRRRPPGARPRRALGPAGFDTEYRRGGALTLDDATVYALSEDQPSAKQVPPAPSEPMPLTRREAEVAVLVAEGLSNKKIAARLVVSPRTAESHIEHILAKLGFTTRAQIAAWAAETLHSIRGRRPE